MTSDPPGPGEPETSDPEAPGTPAGFRRLLGLAPAGRIAVLRALLSGASALDDLIRTSALPRRDVEDFLGALAVSGEGAPPGAPGRRLLVPAARDQYGRLLDDYIASRPGVTQASRAYLQRAASDLVAGVPAPRKRFDHVQATPETLVRRAEWLTENFALSGRSVVFTGDHDVTSLLLSRVVPDATLTVVDIDERLLAYIDSHSVSGVHRGSAVRCVYADLRFGLPPALAGSADLVFTDPPYTPEGLGLFLTRSLAALRRDEPDTRIVIAYGHSRRRPDLGVAAQREIIRQDVVIDGMLPAFNSYAGAQAVGSASDLYCCQPTARAFRRLDYAAEHGSGGHGSGGHGPGGHGTGAAERGLGIYTHGEQSVESGLSGDLADVLPDLLPVLGLAPERLGVIFGDRAPAGKFAVTAGLGKLLDEGLHQSVTRRADEILVDLRDDPGPWLLRAMLALNAPRSVFLVNRGHEALPDPRAATGPWSLAGAKFERISVSPAGSGNLTAVRCELPDGPGSGADPGTALIRYVLQRAHGKLRNVWREGLIAVSAQTGTALTKREARDLVESSTAELGETLADHLLGLRLIDVPAAHFPALHAGLRASAGT
ncbi:MAG TPA: bis-aminopropyl spermidine synthase family protein [Trebonia sp.]